MKKNELINENLLQSEDWVYSTVYSVFVNKELKKRIKIYTGHYGTCKKKECNCTGGATYNERTISQKKEQKLLEKGFVYSHEIIIFS